MDASIKPKAVRHWWRLKQIESVVGGGLELRNLDKQNRKIMGMVVSNFAKAVCAKQGRLYSIERESVCLGARLHPLFLPL